MALVKHNRQTALVILPLKVKAIVKRALASMFVLFEDFLVSFTWQDYLSTDLTCRLMAIANSVTSG